MFFVDDFLAADLKVTERYGAVEITFTISNTELRLLSKYDIRFWRDGCGLSWTEIDNGIFHNNGEGTLSYFSGPEESWIVCCLHFCFANRVLLMR